MERAHAQRTNPEERTKRIDKEEGRAGKLGAEGQSLAVLPRRAEL